MGYGLTLDRFFPKPASDGNIVWNLIMPRNLRQGDDAGTSNVNSVINKLEAFFQEIKGLNLIEV